MLYLLVGNAESKLDFVLSSLDGSVQMLGEIVLQRVRGFVRRVR